MSVCVIGPGAMGCLLAASLARSLGPGQVTLIDHDPARAERLGERGLRVHGQEGLLEARPAVSCALPEEAEVAFLCVKASASAAAAGWLAAGSPDATVAVLQNGCERPAAIAELLGAPARVVGVLTTEGATRLGEGEVRHAGRGRTLVGALEPASEARARRVVELLSAAGWASELAEDLRRASWEKLIVNAAINALSGLLDVPNGALLESPAAAGLADAAACEVAALARASGVSGDWDPAAARKSWRRVAAATATNLSSTVQDLRRGGTTEVPAINGSVARLARERGIPTPTNDTLARLIQAREETRTSAPADLNVPAVVGAHSSGESTNG
ncbi:MAG TPA: 2-dehydropantoate 2-reductase [Planctomycetes bacterium]|nr:2-dehydropantoate 2-reductase [Planctomycetota bacterium]